MVEKLLEEPKEKRVQEEPRLEESICPDHLRKMRPVTPPYIIKAGIRDPETGEIVADINFERVPYTIHKNSLFGDEETYD